MATIDDLPFDDAPHTAEQGRPADPPQPVDDLRSRLAFRFIADIEDLLATGKYTWAETTLRGIQETVEKTGRVSDGQRRAVTNIEHAVDERRDGPRGRRYEGYRR